MRKFPALALICGSLLLSACSYSPQGDGSPQGAKALSSSPGGVPSRAFHAAKPRPLAALPDQGLLLAYDEARGTAKGASSWHPVQLSEEHALNAIGGDIRLVGPDGAPVTLRYERHVEHPDGNWTWIGRVPGASAGGKALLTFGERAVFGEFSDAQGHVMQITTAAGRAWLVQGDPSSVAHRKASAPDFLVAPEAAMATAVEQDASVAMPPQASDPIADMAAASNAMAAAPTAQSLVAVASGSTASEATTVDLVLGYTKGFAERLGGASAANTRLAFIVDVANQALLDSKVNGALRIARTVQVDYPDATTNRSALFELTGVSCTLSQTAGRRLPDNGANCTETGQPAALMPLINAREQARADLVVLVRKLEYPENQSCGVSWLLGGGQTPITAASARFGFSVISDSSGSTFPDDGNTCRQETLAHEVGHNLGLQHDRSSAQGSDDTNTDGDLLDPEEYGVLPYAFGYSNTEESFVTVMSVRHSGQRAYRVFSNPRISVCGGSACGVAGAADNARALAATLPIVAAFRYPVTSVANSGDINGDGNSDLLWRGLRSTSNVSMWLMDGAMREATRSNTLSVSYRVVATGDFNGDGKMDIAWRAGESTRLRIWLGSGSGSFTGYWLESTLGANWEVVGAGDVNGDGKSDLLWRGAGSTNNFVMWLMNGATRIASRSNTLTTSYRKVAHGDFNGDGKLDIAWRSGSSTRLRIWLGDGSGHFTGYWLESSLGSGWEVVGSGDIDGDGKSDLLWRGEGATNNVVMWFMNGASRARTQTNVLTPAYRVVALGDLNGDGKLDIVWRAGADTKVRIWIGNGTGSFTGSWLNSTFGAGWEIVS